MREDISDVIAQRAHDPGGLRTMMTWSFAVHIGVLAAVGFMPRHSTAPAKIIEITLGGSVGPKTSGVTTIGGRPVEQVAPEPKRPEPIKPAAAKPDVMTVPVKPTKAQTPPPKPAEIPKPVSQVTQPPTTGKQITPGTSRAETGVTGIGMGNTIGGGGLGGPPTADVFCCKAYLQDVKSRILSHGWDERQSVRGSVDVRFTIQRDGTLTEVGIERHGDSLLERASLRPFLNLKLPPLPEEYKPSTLTILFTFDYK